MNSVRKECFRTTIAVRVVTVALVLLCTAPHKIQALVPLLATGDGTLSSTVLPAEDWSTSQASFAQAGGYTPLVAGQVSKLTASGAAAGDWFGRSVDASDDTVVVGAPFEDSTFIDSGSVYVFARNYEPSTPGTPVADNWGLVQELTSTDAAEGDHFGISVAVSGDTIVVGVHGDDDAGEGSGSIYVFERNKEGPDNWGQVQKLIAFDTAADDRFGYSVDISGDTIIVGAPYNDDAGDLSGSAYVFERNKGGADNWGQVQKLTASDAEADNQFGNAVVISGDTVVVGADNDDDGGTSSGSAYVFERNYDPSTPSTPVADNWGQIKKLTASDAAAFDSFGYDVAISGDTVIVGAYWNDYSGSAYIFERNYDPSAPGTPVANNWGEVQKLTASDVEANDWFGRSVAINGDTAIIGDPRDGEGDVYYGSVYIFERNQGGADSWGQVQKLVVSDIEEDDQFGEFVAISGDTVIVGAYYDDDACPLDPNCNSGSAYIFVRYGATWAQQQKPTASDGEAYDYLGTSVAISGDILIGGAPGEADDGAAYLFYRNEDGADQWGQVRKKPGPGTSSAEFGESAAIDVDTAVVGAPGADRAYVFERNGSGADLWGHVKTLSGTGGADFGNSVSISGDTAVVGAPYDDAACSSCGAAYVYERNYDPGNPTIPLADNWGLRAVLTATANAATGDQFGWSVTISGDTVVVGARQDTHSGKSQAGSVYVFKRNYDWDHPATPKADNWGLVRNLMASDAAAGDWFGHAVAINGDTFVVGAPFDESGAGSVYVFERNHDWNDGWGQVQKLTADDPASGDWFGWSVGISDDTMVVGAPYDDDDGDGSGSAYVFERNQGGADNWGQVEKLTADDAAGDDLFGWSVSISGNTVVVGAPNDDDGGDSSGSTYVFRWGAAAVYLPLVLKN